MDTKVFTMACRIDERYSVVRPKLVLRLIVVVTVEVAY